MSRRKRISFDGAEFIISPLTMAQVEAYLERGNALVAEDTGDQAKGFKIQALDLVQFGLNNALGPEDPKWTHERLRDELDIISFRNLQSEVLEFSGLRIKEASDQGEARATSESGSQISVVA